MNTFWLKIAGIVVVVMVVIIVIGVFSPSERPQPAVESADEPKTKQKTFYDKVEEDKKEFLAEPQPVKEQVREQKRPADKQTPAEPAQPPEEPTQLYFRPLSEIDSIEAERLLNVAAPGRSIGRLPMTGFKLMVDSCRRIIRKWPDSWYAYRAKQMLADMPTRFRQRYKITEEELDVSEFTKPRPGTKPFTIKDSR